MLLNPYDDLKSGCECLAYQGHSARNWPKLYLNLKAVIVRKMHLSHHERNGYEFLTSKECWAQSCEQHLEFVVYFES